MSQIALSNIKTQIKSILDGANSSGASPINLSNSLTTAVVKVYKVNPYHIPIQNSHFPAITVYFDGKSVDLQTFAKDMATGKRIGNITIKVAGFVWVDTCNDVTQDPADDEIEKLMENIEEVLRTYHTFNGTVNWSKPTKCEYSDVLGENVHMRVGVLTLEANVFY